MSRLGASLCLGLSLVAAAATFAAEPAAPAPIAVPLVERMPNLPRPFRVIDWKARARGFDALAFDWGAKGEFLPLVHLVEKTRNIPPPGFTLPSYVGGQAGSGEGICTLAAVMGATLVGIDKSDQGGRNWVRMCQEWYNPDPQIRTVLNNPGSRGSGSFWYDLLPGLLFCQLTDRYPKVDGMDRIMRSMADRWREACQAMGGPQADFNFTGYDFAENCGKFNGRWREPDAAAGIAWIEYMAWAKWHDPRHLEAADWCMQFLQRRPADAGSPLYETLAYYAPALAARMNAEEGRRYDVSKLVNWCLAENQEKSAARPGWGILAARFGQYDVDGLQGQTRAGADAYAFAMNTFQAAAAMAPLARYDDRYARALGKWLLNVASSARLFYPDGLPPQLQIGPVRPGDPGHVVSYEGLRQQGRVPGKLDGDAAARRPVATAASPFACGDAMIRGKPTDYALYGAAHVGYLAAIVERTEHEHILQIDLLATDFFHGPAYPTFLYYNPDADARRIKVAVGNEPCDLYDAVSNGFVARGVRGHGEFTLAPDSAAVIVVAPVGGPITRKGARTLIGGVPVDWK